MVFRSLLSPPPSNSRTIRRAQCAWAEIYYKALRERGETHSQSARSLGQRWLKLDSIHEGGL